MSQSVQFSYEVKFRPDDGMSVVEQKTSEVDLLNSMIALAGRFGGRNVEVLDVETLPDGSGKKVVLSAEGALDLAAFSQSLEEFMRATDSEAE